MLGYAREHDALVQAIARELSAVRSHLEAGLERDISSRDDGRGPLKGALLTVDAACRMVEHAVSTNPDADWFQADLTADDGDITSLQEAAGLRSSALRARDMAEAKFRDLQLDRQNLLQRLHRLAEERDALQRHLQAAAAAETSKEMEWFLLCKEFEEKTHNIRSEVIARSRRLNARHVLGELFRAQRRGVAKRQARAAQETEGAKTILQLKRSTDAYLASLDDQQKEVEQACAEDKEREEKQAQLLRTNWKENRKTHYKEVEELKADISELEQKYKDSWQDNDRQMQTWLDEQSRRSEEAIQLLENELAAESEILRQQAVSAQAESKQQQMQFEEAGRQAISDMEAQLKAKTREMAVQAEGRRIELSDIRQRYLKACCSLCEEASRYQEGINFLRESYCSLQWPS